MRSPQHALEPAFITSSRGSFAAYVKARQDAITLKFPSSHCPDPAHEALEQQEPRRTSRKYATPYSQLLRRVRAAAAARSRRSRSRCTLALPPG